MTFTEAAIEVLRREGKPLHYKKIAEIAAREDLLDHVGKIPEETMAGQLVAHCRLPKADRRVIAVQHGTFALAEWGLDEDPAGIENLVELPPADELPYRSNERHPIPSREVVRASGRGEGRGEGRGRRREEGEEKRVKRFPPPSEVAYEILAGAGRALGLVEIASQGSERQLMPEAFVRDFGSLRAALLEDNRRRESSGRKALFEFDGESVALAAQPEPGERIPAAVAERGLAGVDLRKSALAALRRRLRECDGPTFEHVAVALLGKLGYQELKVVKRGREHAIYTGRMRLGAADIRHVIRVLRGQGEVVRRDVQDLRRDVANYGAQIGVVLATGEVARDARAEAVAGGQLPVVLLCGETLAEAAAATGTACRQVIVPEVDESFFGEAAIRGAEEETARKARREERDRREGREPREGREGREPREGREGREPREGREGREPREGREGREPREGREGREPREGRRRDGEPTETRLDLTVSGDAGDGTPEAEPPPEVEPSGEGQPSIIEVRATIDDEDEPGSEGGAGEADDEEDEAGDDAEETVGVTAPGAEPSGSAAEGGEGRRRRRRRRRRRGGRGRREGGAVASGPAGEGAAPGPAGEAGSAPAEGRGAGEPPASAPPPSEPPPGGGEASGT